MPTYSIFADSLVYVLIGACAAWFYYHYRRRDLLGGFWGAVVIGVVGAIMIHWLSSLFNVWFIRLVDWLMGPEIGNFRVRVNILAALGGAFLFVSILNRINHDRERRQ
jgi:uncharacterized membrane protein YeaQ/YmgE (transglycosylase-associated protein family)